MKKSTLTLITLCTLIFSACTFSEDNPSIDIENTMYEDFKVSSKALKATGLPTVFLQTENNSKILSKEDWLSAKISLSNAPDEEWNFEETAVSVRGRGNYSWKQPKRSFALKFDEKQKVCGMPSHKRWVLIANYNDNSFMKNVTAFSLSRQLGMDYTVKGEYVNLVLNGNYVGLYWLGEAIKINKKRVNIDEENDYLIEIDSHFDETWKFRSARKKFPFMIKNDDSMTEERLAFLHNRISEMENILYDTNFPFIDESKNEYDESYKGYIDLKSFAQFYLVNEIMNNGELHQPNSCYFTLKANEGLLKAGPVWDFDWAGFNDDNDLIVQNDLYYDALFKIPDFTSEVNSLLAGISTADLSQEIHSTKAYIKKAVNLDEERWGTDFRNPVGESRENFAEYVSYLEACVTSRIKYMKKHPF